MMGESLQSILLAGNNTEWLNTLQEKFERLGHRVQILEAGGIVQGDWVDYGVDIVICIDSTETRQMLKNWREVWSYRHPLMVLLSDAAYVDCGADIVLGFDTIMLEQQILACYAMHRRAQGFAQDNERIKEELASQHKVMNEFEVLKNAIVRNISHELKTPLLQVKSAISLLSEDNDSKLITYATNATAKLEVLIKNITMLGTSLDIQLVPIIPRDVVESAKRSILRIWEHKDAEGRIVLNLAPNLDPVMADKQGLNTVLQLLLDNALKFSYEPVEISVEDDDKGIIFSVIDKGIGIAPEKLQDIFDLFIQLDNSSTRRYSGAGVGLSLVKLILDHHGASIQVKSEAGVGSCFSFKLMKMRDWDTS